MTKGGRKIEKYPAKVDETPCVFTVVTPARHSRLVDREDAMQLTGLRKQPKRRGRNHFSQYRREKTARPSVAEEQQRESQRERRPPARISSRRRAEEQKRRPRASQRERTKTWP